MKQSAIIRYILVAAISMLLPLASWGQSSPSSRYADHSKLADGRWVKIRVGSEGVYQLTKSRLQSMGFSNPDRVSLYGYNMPLLPETKLEDMSDDLTEIPLLRRSDGSLLFYSLGTTKWQFVSRFSSDYTRINNPYSNYIYYFITENTDGSPAELTATTFDAGTDAATTTFREHSLIESDEISMLHSGRNFYESYDYAGTNRRTYTLQTPGIAEQRVSLRVCFVAAGPTASTLSVTAGDTTFTNISLRALGEYEYGVAADRTFTWNKSLTEKSDITLTLNRNSGTSGHLDFLLASYTRRLDISGTNHLAFHLGRTATKKIALSGATEQTRILRVTSPQTTCEVASTLSGGTLTAGVPQTTAIDEYVAINTGAKFPEPEYLGEIKNQDLHALKDIDYVIITPANGHLTPWAERLAQVHTDKEGMRCAVVTADQVYNEFSSGTPDATAYRRFMKMLYDRASTTADRPKNLCLFGDGVWDNRMVTSSMRGENPDNYLLCYESDNSLSKTRSFVLEEYFTLLADGKGVSPLKEAPDCGVGRITVHTANEARAVVNKLASYINGDYAGAWKNTICMMADDGNSNIHMRDADSIYNRMGELYPDFQFRKIYWDSYAREESGAGHAYSGAMKDINKQMTDGALIMNYTGHGSAYILSHEQVLKRSDFETWNSPRLPLWIHAACDVSPFDMNEENIGETALLNASGGAMGSITTTRTVYSSQNRIINVNFMTHALQYAPSGRKYTIGEALSMAKTDIIDGRMSDRDSLNKCHFVLIGDPAISLTVPTYKVHIDMFQGHELAENEADTIGAGAIVEVSGHIEDADGLVVEDFTGTISPTVFDNLELITCHNNPGDDVTPYQFYARTKTLYAGTDSVRNGRFTFSFPVPLDINYSDQSGLISLYAINNDRTIEANGSFESLIFSGTDPDISTDSNGPVLSVSLNGVLFASQSSDSIAGDGVLRLTSPTTMHETPYFVGTIEDPNGINATGSGVGHDITLIIDNDPSMTYNLNSYLQYQQGSWTKGTVAYSLPELATGNHTLLFRAWDCLGNPSTMEIAFDVIDGLQPNILSMKINGPVRDELTLTIENDRPQTELQVLVTIYDISGRELWRHTNSGISPSNYFTYTVNLNENSGHLQPGIYICRATISTGGAKATDEKKFLVVAQ